MTKHRADIEPEVGDKFFALGDRGLVDKPAIKGGEGSKRFPGAADESVEESLLGGIGLGCLVEHRLITRPGSIRQAESSSRDGRPFAVGLLAELQAAVKHNSVVADRPEPQVVALHAGLIYRHRVSNRLLVIENAQIGKHCIDLRLTVRRDRPRVSVIEAASRTQRHIPHTGRDGPNEQVTRQMGDVNIAGSSGIEAQWCRRLPAERRHARSQRRFGRADAPLPGDDLNGPGPNGGIVRERRIGRRGPNVAASLNRHHSSGRGSDAAKRDRLRRSIPIDRQGDIPRSRHGAQCGGRDGEGPLGATDAASSRKTDAAGHDAIDAGNRIDRADDRTNRHAGRLDSLAKQNRSRRIDPHGGRCRSSER